MKTTFQTALRVLVLFGAIGLAFSARFAGAQTTRTWTNAASDNFALATRWTPNGKPTGTDTAVFDEAGTYTISFTANESFGPLSVEAGTVTWSSANTRTVNVSSINVANASTQFRVNSDVRITSSGVTTLNSPNGVLSLGGGRLTTASLQLSQGTLLIPDGASAFTVNGAANIGGQGLTGFVNHNSIAPVNFNGTLNLAPAGASASSVGQISSISGGTIAVDGNMVIGNVSDDNRQGIISVSGSGTTLTQSGTHAITIGRILVGGGSGDTSSRIEVETGGVVTSGTGAITLQNLGHIDVKPGGTFNANGALTVQNNGRLAISGGNYNANAASTVQTGGSIQQSGGTFTLGADLTLDGGSFTQNGTATMGVTGSPDVTVQNGGDYSTVLVYSVPAGSTTLVTGSGSTFATTSGLSVLGTGTTQFRAASGGEVTSPAVQIGSAGLSGTVIAEDSGTLFATTTGISNITRGSLTIRLGAVGALGSVNVGNLAAATGTLSVQTGARLMTGDVDVAAASVNGSIGQIDVSGIGSSLTMQGDSDLRVGGAGFGTGSINVSSSGGFHTGTGAILVRALGTINANGGTFDINGPMEVVGGVISATNGGTIRLEPNQSLRLEGGALAILGSFNLNSNAVVTVDNSELRLTTLNPDGGSVNVLSGLVNFTQSTTLTGGQLSALFGTDATLLAGRTLQVQGSANLQSGLTLDGGTLTVDFLGGGNLLNLQRGTLNLMASNLTVGNVGQFGSTLTLGPNVSVNVQGAGFASVDSGALLLLTGGQLTTFGNIVNNGSIQLTNTAARLNTQNAGSVLLNQGLLSGTGRINATLNNTATGNVRAETTEHLTFSATPTPNAGKFTLLGGTLEFSQPLTNGPNGQILGNGTLMTGGAGLTNNGQIIISNGISSIFGDVNNNTGAAAKGITITGNADATFWDDVTNTGASLFKVTTGSSATFFGSYGGTGVTGGGDLHFEGDLTPGSSPALVTFDNQVHLGSLSTTKIELGGLAAGSQHDKIDVNGQLELGGKLDVSLINSFNPSLGATFDILDWNTRSGTFSSIQLPTLGGTLDWSTHRLYTDGVLKVVDINLLPGDFNRDLQVTAADIPAMLHALTDLDAYKIEKGLNDGNLVTIGDLNNSGTVTNRDIQSLLNFLATRGSGAVATVPEPSSVCLMWVGAFAILSGRRMLRRSNGRV